MQYNNYMFNKYVDKKGGFVMVTFPLSILFLPFTPLYSIKGEFIAKLDKV
jgi:hypothetical protein